MNLKILPILFILPILNGCMTYSESFDCPPGKGVGCKSLSQVNKMVEDGDLPLEIENTTQEVSQEPKIPAGWIEAKNTSQSQNLRIWFAEYKDSEGNTHSPSYVYASLDTNSDNRGVKENS